MLAAVKTAPGAGLEIRDVPVPEPGPGEVRIRVRAVGICGSDLPIIAGTRAVPIPLIPGHEFAGDVDCLGPAVSGLAPGDRVSVRMILGCLRCDQCRSGRENVCESISEIGIHRDGAFAEYVVAPARAIHLLQPNTSYEQGATADPVASSYRGIRRLDPGPEDRVVVLGVGPVGLYALQALRACGVQALACVVRHGGPRAESARSLGVPVVGSADAATEVEGLLGRRPTIVVEASGDPDAIGLALDLADRAATILVVGIYHDRVDLDPARISRAEIVLRGTFGYSADDFAASLALIEAGLIKPVVSHRLPLGEVAEAVELLRSRQAVKVVLLP